jgi:hypothetical protein
MLISYKDAQDQYKATLNALLDKHGSWNAIPRDAWFEASETLRLHAVLELKGGKVTQQDIAYYSIPDSVVRKVNPSFEGFEPKQKRSDKYDAVYKWLDSNPTTLVTTQEFSDIAELSYPTALKFIENNPQYFRKVKRGQYEVRDPDVERKADK